VIRFALALSALAAAQTATPVRLQVTLGHIPIPYGGKYAVQYSMDGRHLLTSGSNGEVLLWGATDGMELSGIELRRFQGLSADVVYSTFADSDRFVFAVSKDGTAILWETVSGNVTWKHAFDFAERRANCASLSNDRRFVLIGHPEKGVLLYDRLGEREVHMYKPPAAEKTTVASASFSPDGTSVLIGYIGEQTIKYLPRSERPTPLPQDPIGSLRFFGLRLPTTLHWLALDGRLIRTFEGYKGTFSKDGKYLLSIRFDGGAQWEVSSGRLVFELSLEDLPIHRMLLDPADDSMTFGSGKPQPLSVAYSRDESLLLVGWFGAAQVLSVKDGKELTRFSIDDQYVTSVSLSPDGARAAVATRQGEFVLFRATDATKAVFLSGATLKIDSLKLSLKRSILLLQSWAYAGFLDLSTNEFAALAHGDEMTSIKVAASGQRFLTAGHDGVARIWDPPIPNASLEFKSNGPIDAADMSEDGLRVITASRVRTEASTRSELILWSADNGTRIREFPEFAHKYARIDRVAFIPGTNLLLVEDTIVDSSSGAIVADLDGGNCAVSPLGDLILVDSGYISHESGTSITGGASLPPVSYPDSIPRLHRPTGELVRALEEHKEGVSYVGFSADGKYALTGSFDGSARRYDIETGKREATYFGHEAEITAMAMSSDGKILVIGYADGTVGLWDAKSGRRLATLFLFVYGGWAVVDPEGRYDAMNPDDMPGMYWVTEGYDEIIRLGQLKDRYYEKGLLRKILNKEPMEKRALFDRVYLPPRATVLNVDAKARKARIKLESVRDGGYGDVLVMMNGQEVPDAVRLEAPFDPKAPSHEIEVDLSKATFHPSGENVLSVLAKGHNNLVQSRLGQGTSAKVESEKRELRQPRLFVLAVGITEYAGKQLALRWAAKDALNLAEAARVIADPLYKEVIVKSLVSGANRPPTRANILTAMEEIKSASRQEDVLLVFLAGHGTARKDVREGEIYYFLTAEAAASSTADAELLAGTSISSTELKTWLIQPEMPASRVLILDTCQAGAASQELNKMRELTSEETRIIERLKDRGGSWVLMGSSPNGAAYEATMYENGLLTYALLEGLRSGRMGDGQEVMVDNWFKFGVEELKKAAERLGVRQEPRPSIPDGRAFPIGKIDAERRARIPVSREVTVLLQAKVRRADIERDPLRLKQAINEKLLLTSGSTPRGGRPVAEAERLLVYIADNDDEPDDLPWAFKPYVIYQEENDGLTAKVELYRKGRESRVSELRGPNDREAMAGKIVEWIQKELAQ
jgi:WD40 repeat protein